jgi:anti-anti-sigma factor
VSNPAQGGTDQLPLRIQVRRDAASSVVEISGEMDLATAPTVQKALDGLFVDGERHVIVDLGGLEFMDLSGIRVLEEFGNRLAADHGRLELRRPTRTVGRLLALLDQIPGLHPRPWVCQEQTEKNRDTDPDISNTSSRYRVQVAPTTPNVAARNHTSLLSSAPPLPMNELR